MVFEQECIKRNKKKIKYKSKKKSSNKSCVVSRRAWKTRKLLNNN